MLKLIAADLRAAVDHTRVTGAMFWIKVIGKLLITPQVQVVVLYRVSSMLAGTPLRPLAFVLRSWAMVIGSADIHPDAQIGPGLSLVHSSGVAIGADVRIGKDCRLAQGVALGEPGRGSLKNSGFPTLGDHVTLGANAVVLGSQHIGTGVIVGANSVVLTDLPDYAVAVGTPARIVRMNDPGDLRDPGAGTAFLYRDPA